MANPSPTPALSSTQIGAIGENLLVNAVMKASNGRLSPFKPIADDDGLDVLFFDKETGNSVAIQLKCRTKTDRKSNSKERGNTAQFDVRKATFKEARSAYLVAALLNKTMTDFVCSWFIPMKELRRVGKSKSNKYVITPSKAEEVKDKYEKFPMRESRKTSTAHHQSLRKQPKDKEADYRHLAWSRWLVAPRLYSALKVRNICRCQQMLLSEADTHCSCRRR